MILLTEDGRIERMRCNWQGTRGSLHKTDHCNTHSCSGYICRSFRTACFVLRQIQPGPFVAKVLKIEIIFINHFCRTNVLSSQQQDALLQSLPDQSLLSLRLPKLYILSTFSVAPTVQQRIFHEYMLMLLKPSFSTK